MFSSKRKGWLVGIVAGIMARQHSVYCGAGRASR